MKKQIAIALLCLCACTPDPIPVISNMSYKEVREHMPPDNNHVTISQDGWDWIVTLPDGVIGRIDNNTRLNLCTDYGGNFCLD